MDHGFCAEARAFRGACVLPAGFTLVEMMVVLVLMAVMAGLALPGFRGLVERYRIERLATALVASMSHARSEAIRRGRTVRIQPGAQCSGTDWSCGWETVVEVGKDTEVLRRQDPDGAVQVERTASGALSFDAMGHTPSAAGFKLFPAANPASPRRAVVCMSLGGRVLLATGVEKCPAS